MFTDPSRQDETTIYLYAERTRGALCIDHSWFYFNVAGVIAQYPQQSVPFYVLQTQALIPIATILVSSCCR
jgi:hypothetical protein